MPFKVKATVTGFAGDEEKYPCHFNYKIGDEIIWDGEKIIGKICPLLVRGFWDMAEALYHAGKKWRSVGSYAIWRYSGLSIRDLKMKKYDGRGFAPTKEDGMGLKWVDGVPIAVERPIEYTVICGDRRTGVTLKFEIIGLSEDGYDAPYYRREMSILEKIKAKPGIEVNKILNEFTKWERANIYPPLSAANLAQMLDELVQVDYIEVRDGRVYPVKK